MQCAVEIARTVNSRRPGGFEIGIGVNSGPVVAGSIGGAGRLSFSVIGDAVNLCSRVEAKTRETGDPVLITEATRAQLSETIEVESRGELEIRGYSEPIELYAPLIPEVVSPGEPGHDVSDPLASPGVGRAWPADRMPGTAWASAPPAGSGGPHRASAAAACCRARDRAHPRQANSVTTTEASTGEAWLTRCR